MEAKDALTGAAVVVLLGVLGFLILVGVILLMMWKQPGIEHSPSQQSVLSAPGVTDLGLDPLVRCQIIQLNRGWRSHV